MLRNPPLALRKLPLKQKEAEPSCDARGAVNADFTVHDKHPVLKISVSRATYLTPSTAELSEFRPDLVRLIFIS